MKKISEPQLDKAFSLAVRTKGNWTCEKCGLYVEPPTAMIQCSHFHSRVARSVRFDFDNADCLCARCHRFFENRKTAEYTDWKLAKMGKAKFEALKKRYYTAKRGGFTEKEKQEMVRTFKEIVHS